MFKHINTGAEFWPKHKKRICPKTRAEAFKKWFSGVATKMQYVRKREPKKSIKIIAAGVVLLLPGSGHSSGRVVQEAVAVVVANIA